MTHEENVYPDPFTFKPERFFDGDGKLKDEDRLLAFGFGRRYIPSFTIVNHATHNDTGFVLESRSQAQLLVLIIYSECQTDTVRAAIRYG
jgi:hypothetical protein